MVEEVFQDRGKSLNPNGIDENQRLRRPQGIGIARDGGARLTSVLWYRMRSCSPRKGRNRRSRGRYATVTTCLCSPEARGGWIAYQIKTRSGVPHR